MKLDLWRRDKNLSYVGLGNLLNVSNVAARRYCTGEKMPRPEYLQRIFKVTDGQVTANDFVYAAPGDTGRESWVKLLPPPARPPAHDLVSMETDPT